MPVSSATSRAAACSALSPRLGCPLGKASTRLPAASRLTGTITATSSPRTTTPPAENSAGRGLVDVSLERRRVMHHQLPATLRDDPGPLEHGQKPARGFP